MANMLISTLKERFDSLVLANPEFASHIRNDFVLLVNEIDSIFDNQGTRSIIEDSITTDAILEYFPTAVTAQKQRELMLTILGKCLFLAERSTDE